MSVSSRLPAAARTAVAAACCLLPLVAHAEERGPGEVGHFILIVTVFSALFLSFLAFAVWLLIARLRDRDEPSAATSSEAGRRANLESIWFRAPPGGPPRR